MEEQKPKGNTPEYRAWYYKNKYQKTGKTKKKEFEQRNKEFIIRFKKRCKCIKCNLKKADRTPEEAKMKLRKQPYIPTLVTENNIVSNLWNDFQKSFVY